jgi:hypothetical protein
MKSRIGSIIGWICTGLVAAFTIFSAVMEFVPMTDPATLAFLERLGVNGIEHELGIAKFIIAALYLIPRTSVVGFVLMIGYFGGALATNITHQFTMPEYAPLLLVFVLMTIDAWFRKPELTARLLGKKI